MIYLRCLGGLSELPKVFSGATESARDSPLLWDRQWIFRGCTRFKSYFVEQLSGLLNELIKVDISNPEAPTTTSVYKAANASNGEISGFLVGPESDVFVHFGAGLGSALIKRANGGIQNVVDSS